MYYDNWNHHNVVHGYADRCDGARGRTGCGCEYFNNNRLLGGKDRPILFNKLVRKCINGKEINVLVADNEFFNRLRFDESRCRDFYASICTCLEWNDDRPVFLSSGKCEKLLPLVTSRLGFLVTTDMIQPHANNTRCLLRLTNCYDCELGGDHVAISNYYRKHLKCSCKEDDKFGCGCDHDHNDSDGIPDSPVI